MNAVVAFHQNVALVLADRIVTVDKIKTGGLLQPLNQRGPSLDNLDPVPAHVRHLQLRMTVQTETPHGKGNVAKAVRYAFLAAKPQHLHPETNAQNRLAGSHGFVQRAPHPALVQKRHALIERPDPR